jgi:hypothetical protein
MIFFKKKIPKKKVLKLRFETYPSKTQNEKADIVKKKES